MSFPNPPNRTRIELSSALQMRERKFAPFVRLEVDCEMPSDMALRLTEELQLSRDDVYRVCGPMALGGERISSARRRHCREASKAVRNCLC